MGSIQVLRLPIGGSGCEDMELSSDGTELDCIINYLSAAQLQTVAVRFKDVIAFRFRDEMHSTGFADGSYDTIVEIDDSTWIRELLQNEPRGILGGVKGKHHIAVLLSNVGYLEVIGESAEIVSE